MRSLQPPQAPPAEPVVEWCAVCRAAVLPSRGRCPACEGPTRPEVENRLVHAQTGRVIVWVETAAARQARYAKLAAAVRKIPDDVAELARALYDEEQLSMREAAQAIFDTGLTAHAHVERLEEGLRRHFRKRRWPTRTTAETLRGRACRTIEQCRQLNNKGQPCNGNVVRDGCCWQHHPDYERDREALAHMGVPLTKLSRGAM